MPLTAPESANLVWVFPLRVPRYVSAASADAGNKLYSYPEARRVDWRVFIAVTAVFLRTIEDMRMVPAAVTDRISQSPRLYARIAGALYAVVIVGGVFAELFVRGRLVVPGDAVATAHNIMAHQLLYRTGLAIEVFYLVCNVPITIIFYTLFKVVNRHVALLEAIFGLLSTAVEGVSLLAHYAPLAVLGGDRYLNAFSPEQLQAAAYLSLRLFEGGFAISLVFFAFDCLALAYLIVKSTFFPRLIGVLLGIEGVGYLVNSFALLLLPEVHARIFSYFMPTAIAEIALCLWLLVMGVNVQRWKEQAATAEGA